VVLGLMEDGADPWHHTKHSTSIWPMVMKIFNLPPQLRDKFEFSLIYAITNGMAYTHARTHAHTYARRGRGTDIRTGASKSVAIYLLLYLSKK
jgi:hypothetical protein